MKKEKNWKRKYIGNYTWNHVRKKHKKKQSKNPTQENMKMFFSIIVFIDLLWIHAYLYFHLRVMNGLLVLTLDSAFSFENWISVYPHHYYVNENCCFIIYILVPSNPHPYTFTINSLSVILNAACFHLLRDYLRERNKFLKKKPTT